MHVFLSRNEEASSIAREGTSSPCDTKGSGSDKWKIRRRVDVGTTDPTGNNGPLFGQAVEQSLWVQLSTYLALRIASSGWIEGTF